MWNLMADKCPEPGQLCVIQFEAEGASLRLCRYDNRESWEKRNPHDDSMREDDWGDWTDPWFTEHDDETDWWEAQYVRAWAQIEEPQR